MNLAVVCPNGATFLRDSCRKISQEQHKKETQQLMAEIQLKFQETRESFRVSWIVLVCFNSQTGIILPRAEAQEPKWLAPKNVPLVLSN